jgi:hypothetical protein
MWHQFGCTVDKNRVFDRQTGAPELLTPLPTERYVPTSPNLVLEGRFRGGTIQSEHIALVEFLVAKLPIACARNDGQLLRVAGSFDCVSGRANSSPNGPNTPRTRGVLNGSGKQAFRDDQMCGEKFFTGTTVADLTNRPPRFAATGANRGS